MLSVQLNWIGEISGKTDTIGKTSKGRVVPHTKSQIFCFWCLHNLISIEIELYFSQPVFEQELSTYRSHHKEKSKPTHITMHEENNCDFNEGYFSAVKSCQKDAHNIGSFFNEFVIQIFSEFMLIIFRFGFAANWPNINPQNIGGSSEWSEKWRMCL